MIAFITHTDLVDVLQNKPGCHVHVIDNVALIIVFCVLELLSIVLGWQNQEKLNENTDLMLF